MFSLRTVKNLKRLNHIAGVLARHGFGELLSHLSLPAALSLRQKLSRARPRPSTWTNAGQRLRAALEELGPTFVKIGQALSARPELTNEAVAMELSKLQAQVAPFPAAEARRILEQELGQRLEAVFSEFDDIPVAAGSIGQVHRARLLGGQEVAVKVQRPRIRHTIEADLSILRYLVGKIEERFPELEVYEPREVVEEIARAFNKELDYLNELVFLRRFAADFADFEGLVVPEAYPRWCSARVLVTGFLHGVHLDQANPLSYDRKLVARNLAGVFLRGVLERGFFHSDPHGGNVMLLPDSVVALLDYGQMGWISRRRVASLTDLLTALNRGDSERTTQVLLRLGRGPANLARDRLVGQVEALVLRHYRPSAGRVELGRLVERLLGLAQDNGVRIPPDITLVVKAMLTTEELVFWLDPEIELARESEPYLRRALVERFAPGRLASQLVNASDDVFDLAASLPHHGSEILRRLAEGHFVTELRHEGLERLIHAMEHGSSRIAFAMVIGSLIVGSSMLVDADFGPNVWGISSLGLGGYLIAALMGLWLLFGIIRSGRL